ncbi:MAG TPA: TetR/AcrR family transcriptional regulator [Clostridia bacterium]|nr:TetR/AcrR family transcriptional regulator [Clostridia bacterium]
MARAEDLRVQRTKKLIQQAFYECVKEKGFEKTTVSDIAKKAMINRATFYLHYQDKMDLLRCLEEEVLSDIEKIFQPATREYIQVCREKGVPFPHIVELLSYVQEKAEFFILMVRYNVDSSFFKKMSAHIYHRIFQVLFPELKSKELLVHYAQNILVAVFSSIVDQWIETGMQESKEEIAMLMTKMGLSLLASFQSDLS